MENKTFEHHVQFMTGQFIDSTKCWDKLSGVTNTVMSMRTRIDDFIMQKHGRGI